jgi:uncharacterized protein YuzE
MIRQSYDLQADALYVELEDRDAARTVQVDPGTLVDLDAAGHILGIEVIHPARQWPLTEILHRFEVSAEDARELRVYFPTTPRTSLPAEPLDAGLRVAISR